MCDSVKAEVEGLLSRRGKTKRNSTKPDTVVSAYRDFGVVISVIAGA